MKCEASYEKGKCDDWGCDKEKTAVGLQHQKRTQRAVTNTPGRTGSSDERLHVRLGRLYPLLLPWTRKTIRWFLLFVHKAMVCVIVE